jgi:hypothetical protein
VSIGDDVVELGNGVARVLVDEALGLGQEGVSGLFRPPVDQVAQFVKLTPVVVKPYLFRKQ